MAAACVALHALQGQAGCIYSACGHFVGWGLPGKRCIGACGAGSCSMQAPTDRPELSGLLMPRGL